jgi:hypothetical protein
MNMKTKLLAIHSTEEETSVTVSVESEAWFPIMTLTLCIRLSVRKDQFRFGAEMLPEILAKTKSLMHSEIITALQELGSKLTLIAFQSEEKAD